MKYLKKYNESRQEILLQNFCQDYLSYLYDEGYEVGINDLGYEYELTFRKHYSFEPGFTWNQIKDQFIPFLITLDNEYDLKRHTGYFSPIVILFVKFYHSSQQTYSLDDIENYDTIDSDRIYKLKNEKIACMQFKVWKHTIQKN